MGFSGDTWDITKLTDPLLAPLLCLQRALERQKLGEPLKTPQTPHLQLQIELNLMEMQIHRGFSGDRRAARRPGAGRVAPLPGFPLPDPWWGKWAGGSGLPSVAPAFCLWIWTNWLGRTGAGGAKTRRGWTLTCDPSCFSLQTAPLHTHFPFSRHCQPQRPLPAPQNSITKSPRGQTGIWLQGSPATPASWWRREARRPLETARLPPHRSHSPLSLGVLRCCQMAELNLLRRHSKKGKLN